VKKRKIFLFVCCLSLLWSIQSTAQEVIPADIISIDMVDLPNASTFQKGFYGIGLRTYPNGGVLSGFTVGILDRMYARVYYGGENLIGNGSVNWNPQVGLELRIRVIEETLVTPAIAIGINTQGYGAYNEIWDRYLIKSRGLYAVASRNYSTRLGDLSIHGGVNFSFEQDDEDKDMNFFVAVNKSVRSFSEIVLEYDSAVNDNEEISFGDGSGYLNAGLRFFISNNFSLAFYFKDLLENTKNTDGFGREICLEYRRAFRK